MGQQYPRWHKAGLNNFFCSFLLNKHHLRFLQTPHTLQAKEEEVQARLIAEKALREKAEEESAKLRAAQEKAAKEKVEREKVEKEKLEREKLERDRAEQERVTREILAKQQKIEQEARERQRLKEIEDLKHVKLIFFLSFCPGPSDRPIFVPAQHR
jgi:hypothetical protein